MDRAARIEAVKSRIDSQREGLLAVREFVGRPCTGCAHYLPAHSPDGREPGRPHCGHLALSTQSYDVVVGLVAARYDITADQARSEDGLCGPAGALFESPRDLVPPPKRMIDDPVFLWLLAVPGFLATLTAAGELLRFLLG